MKPLRTLTEARALAAARRRQMQSREQYDRAHAEALARWRRIPVLWKWREERR